MSGLEFRTITVTPFAQNARIVWCTETRQGVIIDPGGEPKVILSELETLGVQCAQVWLTHSHLDHCGGVRSVLEHLKIPLVAHPVEQRMRANVRHFAAMYGLPLSEWEDCPEPDIHIQGGEELRVGKSTAHVLFTPGHSPGHLAFYFRESSVLVAGDVLFAGSIGRTDLPGGDMATLLGSIKREILPLSDDVVVLSGHGEDTTVGAERHGNPFLREIV